MQRAISAARLLAVMLLALAFAGNAAAEGNGVEAGRGRSASLTAQEARWESVSSARVFTLPDAAFEGAPFAVVYVPAAGRLPGPGRRRPAGTPRRAKLYSPTGHYLAGGVFFRFPLDGAGHEALVALLTVPSTAGAGAGRLVIVGAKRSLDFTIKEKSFHSETIPLNAANTGIRAKPDPRKIAQSKKLAAILFTTSGSLYCEGPFKTPLAPDTRRTSFYGDRRVYRYANGKTARTIHFGIDFHAPTGTQVHACAPGRVVMAERRIVTGNSIVLEHMPGVYSLYYHLSKIKVKPGDVVQAGQIIGLSGATGLATGPHLHWEIRVSGESTDPDAVTARPLISRPLILQKLFAGRREG